MAHIEDRWWREIKHPGGRVEKVKKARHGKGRRWKLRYVDLDGNEQGISFDRKVDADNKRKEIEADLLRGVYVDPDAGRMTFRKFGEQVVRDRAYDEATRAAVERRLRKHAYPVLGDKELRYLARRPSVIQSWISGLDLAPAYVHVVFAHVSAIFSTAVDDERVPRNPCKAASVTLPRIDQKKVVPWPEEWVHAMRGALGDRYAATVDAGAGLGLRQGEILGLSPDDVDWLRGWIHVRRQLRNVDGKLVFTAPKGGRERDVPLPQSVSLRLAAHLKKYPAAEVALPWGRTNGEPATVKLMFTTSNGTAVKHNYLTERFWRPALEAAGIVPAPAKGEKRKPHREHGMHALRHHYASVLLDAGESIRAVSEYLGHRDPGFTLRTYAHIMPASPERTRKAIDAVFGESSNGPGTAQEGAR